MKQTNVSLKRKIALLPALLVLAITTVAQTGGRHGYVSAIDKAPSTEVRTMIDYIRKAEKGGLDVQLYLSELADQMAYLALGDQISAEIMQQGEAAARLYAHPLVLNNFAALLVKIGQVGQAISYLKVAYGQDPGNPMVAQSLGRCYFSQGRFDLAETYCNEALRLNGNYGLALQLRAMLYLRNDKDQMKAIEPMLKSALTVWNDISASQFSSLRNALEELAVKDGTKSPLDKHVNLLLDICKVDRKVAPDVGGGNSFPFYRKKNDSETLMELSYKEVAVAIEGGAETVTQGLTQAINMLRDISYSKESDALYNSDGGPNAEGMLLDDSRQICAALLLHSHYKIKRNEMHQNEISRISVLFDSTELDKLIEKRGVITKEFSEKMEVLSREAKIEGAKIIRMIIQSGQIPTNININPEEVKRVYIWKMDQDAQLYNESVNAGTRYLHAERLAYEEYRRPFLREYRRNMRQAIFCIRDDRERGMLGELVDGCIESMYMEKYTDLGQYQWLGILEQNDLELKSSRKIVNPGKPVITEEERKKRQMEWEEKYVSDLATSRGAPKSAGMLQVKVAFGGLSAHFGVDNYNRVHYGYETERGIYRVSRNLASGINTTTTISKVETSFKDMATGYTLQTISAAANYAGGTMGKLGGFMPSSSSRSGEGTQITRDRSGNILDQVSVRYSSSGAGIKGVSLDTQEITRRRVGTASSVSRTNKQEMIGYSASLVGASLGIGFGRVER